MNTKLTKIWLEKYDGEVAIRISWNNNRYQRVVFKDDSPSAVIKGLEEASRFIKREISSGYIEDEYYTAQHLKD